jgi:hypothetical protein
LRTLAARAGKAGCPDRTKYDARARRLSFFEHYARRLSAAAIIGDAHVSHKVEEELRQRLARALAARALDELQVELTPAQTPAGLAAWPPLPTQEIEGVSSSRAIRSVEILRPLVLPLLSVIVRYRPLRPLRVSFAPTGWLQSSPFIPPSPRDPARPRAIPSHPEPSRAMPMAPVHFL